MFYVPWKKGFFLIVTNIILYDICLLLFGSDFNRNMFFYYIFLLDIFVFLILLPFSKMFKPIRRAQINSDQVKKLHLLYQAQIPGAEAFSDEELYDIINLRTSIPEHSCSKSDYIQHLKRNGLLIINGQHIWLYGIK